MATFGSFVYSSAQYGTGDAGTQPTFTGAYLWTLLIRWDSDWVNEAGRCVGARGNRGRKFYVSQGADSFEPVQPGQFYFTLDNFDGRYDPYNGSSPLTGHILPGREVQFRVKVLSNGNTYSIFTGRIRDIRPISGVNQVEVLVVDALQWLADQDITIPVAYNVKVDQAIKHTLNAASYPYPVSLGVSNCPITYFDPDEANALDTLRALCDAGIGTAFVDSSGVLRYYDLTKTGIPTHTLDQAVLLKEIAVTQPWETVRNKITTIANRYGYGPLEEIWRLDEPVYIDASSSATFKIEFETAAVIQPVPGVDYDESTILYNGRQFGVFPTIRVGLSGITSTGATVTIVNSNSASTYMNFLAIRGNKLVNKKVTFFAGDSASVADYGPRRFRIDSPWLQDRGFAEAYAILLKNFLKDPSKSPVVQVETREDALDLELFDRITLTSAKLGINNIYDLGGLDFEWLEPTGQGFRYRFYLHNILYSTATITPQPFYPGLPPVPGVTPPGTPANPPGGFTWQETLSCLSPYPAPAGASGPYAWPAGEINNSNPAWFNVGYWFRSLYHPHRTYVEIDGFWESGISGIWAPDASFDFASIVGYNSLGQAVLTGTLSGGMVADGTRRYYFNNTHGYYVARLKMEFVAAAGGPSSFSVGSAISSGAFTLPTPGEISGLTVGNWYAIEASGGPMGPNIGSGYSYTFGLSTNGSSFSGVIGMYLSTGEGMTQQDFILQTPSFCSYSERLGNSNYGRAYFQATTTSVWITMGSGGTGWHGSLGWTLRNAIVSGGDKRIRVRSVKLYNVCEGIDSSSAV